MRDCASCCARSRGRGSQRPAMSLTCLAVEVAARLERQQHRAHCAAAGGREPEPPVPWGSVWLGVQRPGRPGRPSPQACRRAEAGDPRATASGPANLLGKRGAARAGWRWVRRRGRHGDTTATRTRMSSRHGQAARVKTRNTESQTSVRCSTVFVLNFKRLFLNLQKCDQHTWYELVINFLFVLKNCISIGEKNLL